MGGGGGRAGGQKRCSAETETTAPKFLNFHWLAIQSPIAQAILETGEEETCKINIQPHRFYAGNKALPAVRACCKFESNLYIESLLPLPF